MNGQRVFSAVLVYGGYSFVHSHRFQSVTHGRSINASSLLVCVCLGGEESEFGISVRKEK